MEVKPAGVSSITPWRLTELRSLLACYFLFHQAMASTKHDFYSALIVKGKTLTFPKVTRPSSCLCYPTCLSSFPQSQTIRAGGVLEITGPWQVAGRLGTGANLPRLTGWVRAELGRTPLSPLTSQCSFPGTRLHFGLDRKVILNFSNQHLPCKMHAW